MPDPTPRLTDSDFLRIAAAASFDPAFVAALSLARDGGLRLGEIANLRWTDLDPETGGLLPCSKGRSRLVPLAPPLIALLRALRRGDRNFLFTSREQLVRMLTAAGRKAALSCRPSWAALRKAVAATGARQADGAARRQARRHKEGGAQTRKVINR